MKKVILLFILCTLYTLNTQYTLSQWVQQTLPVSKPITGIKFIDSLKGWACTSNSGSPDEGYVLHTSNGGVNWFVQLISASTSFNAVCVIDSSITYAGGSTGNGKLYRTTNSGNNWIELPVPSRITDMTFVNKDSGYYCADLIGADVRTTTNGGLNWIVRINGILSQTQRIFFLNYSTGFCGAGFNLYKTANAGLNWGSLYQFSQQITSIFFLNNNIGWVGAQTNSMIYFTSNAGVNWITQSNPNYAGPTDIYFINNQTGWAANRYLTIYKTTNGGNNWGYQFDTSQSYKISIVDSLLGWGGGFSISHTTNGGGPIIFTGFVNNGTTIPAKFTLHQNYPNPFNPATTIKLDLPKASKINLFIYDILGRELYTIADQNLTAGTYSFMWDARKYSSGIYFYRLTADAYTETKKMVLIK